ncbi:MAG: ABC transporter ATP-binding protein [Alphaproteobacteria bacterium]|nr:ABC transporter ATP-binding protein [Rhizobiaceae bacterium]MBU3961747.1 ABC transporter ATP-binding protein [Alphaproteobacteria bacterium]MBU4051752.1 ABC transporter ATP-binding protein [Alphaproteobacteria bacterium]MBU4090059.1 ABC transporter ATP-binding protein [Alphaproteobacteria bacterium]MBU4157292.1 ABC transporter ATP-binding protein [Alphaproteobacteria bacterium]
MTDRLTLAGVGVRRGGTRILHDVSASLAPGQIVGLVGPNGAGKSTLLNAIAGLAPYDGEIAWGGRRVDIREIGFMPQQCQVRAELSVLEVVLLGRHERLGWRVGDAVLQAASDMLERFGVAELAGRAMQTLSGGQQQLVLLAQRLLREPGLLLLDEATSALDIRHQMRVFDLLGTYVARTGALVLIAIHDLNLAARHSDNILLLNGGRLEGMGLFEEIVTPQALRTVYGIEAEVLSCRNGRPVVVPHASADR